MSEEHFFIDYSRCIGCQACVQACAECDTHRTGERFDRVNCAQHLHAISPDDPARRRLTA